jgi:hypothetical protein
MDIVVWLRSLGLGNRSAKTKHPKATCGYFAVVTKNAETNPALSDCAQ